MSAGTAAVAGAAAAAAIAAAQRQEEEEMTPYSTHDLAEGWEFKILRTNNFASFRDPQRLKAVLDEEKQGGWVLVEKFDDYRIRLKRPAGTKAVQGDFADHYDPYRTTIGSSQGTRTAIILGAVSIFLVVFMATMMRIRP